SFFASRVVEVQPRLELAFAGEARRLGSRAREGLAVDAAAAVHLRRFRAMAAGDQFGGARFVVVIGFRTKRIDLRRAFVCVSRPTAGLSGDVGIPEARRPSGSLTWTVGARRSREGAQGADEPGERQRRDGER